MAQDREPRPPRGKKRKGRLLKRALSARQRAKAASFKDVSLEMKGAKVTLEVGPVTISKR